MLVVPYVCAEFHDRNGTVLHTIQPADLRGVTEVPDSIRQDPLFDMLVRDGSLRVPETKEELKQLENDPEAKPQDPIPEKKPEAPEPEQKQKPRNEAGNKPSSRQGSADKP